MNKFSDRSLKNLSTCDIRLIGLFKRVLKVHDCSVLCGHRNEEDQNKAYEQGFSKLRYPRSKHNSVPSLAVDVVPFPIDWDDIERFKAFAVIVKEIAEEIGIEVFHGGDWENFKDYPHWELVD